MIKKDIDVKSLVKRSVDQVYETRMPKDVIKEEEANKSVGGEINLFSLFPMFKSRKKTFSSTNKEFMGRNETLYRNIFDKFKNPNLKIALKNLNDALGISFKYNYDPRGKQQVNLNISETSETKLSDLYSSLAIISAMEHASAATESVTGILYEPIITGLLGGITRGFANNIEDIRAEDPQEMPQGLDGNNISLIDYSLKVVKGEYTIKPSPLIKALSEKRKFKLIVVLKQEAQKINNVDGKTYTGMMYNFYQVDLDEEYLFKMAGGKNINKVTQSKEWFDSYVAGLNSFAKTLIKPGGERNKQKIKDQKNNPERFEETDLEDRAAIDNANIALKIKNDFASSENTSITAMRIALNDQIKNLDQIAGEKRPYHQEMQKKYDDSISGVKGDEQDENELEEAAIKPIKTKISTVDPVKTWEDLFRNTTGGRVDTGLVNSFYKGSIFLSRSFYLPLLQQRNTATITKIIEILNPLNDMLNNTNNYFVNAEEASGVESLRLANQNAKEFETAVQKVLSPSAEIDQQPAPVAESLDLTDEAKMVIELLESYNRRNNG
jgi:hypothetical protein